MKFPSIGSEHFLSNRSSRVGSHQPSTSIPTFPPCTVAIRIGYTVYSVNARLSTRFSFSSVVSPPHLRQMFLNLSLESRPHLHFDERRRRKLEATTPIDSDYFFFLLVSSLLQLCERLLTFPRVCFFKSQ